MIVEISAHGGDTCRTQVLTPAGSCGPEASKTPAGGFTGVVVRAC